MCAQLAVVVHRRRIVQNDNDISWAKCCDRCGFDIEGVMSKDAAKEQGTVVLFREDADGTWRIDRRNKGSAHVVPLPELDGDVAGGNQIAGDIVILHILNGGGLSGGHALTKFPRGCQCSAIGCALDFSTCHGDIPYVQRKGQHADQHGHHYRSQYDDGSTTVTAGVAR